MKKNLLKFLGLGMLFVVFSACPKDECKDVNCGDNGVCVEGICLCDDGYEQDATGACTVEAREKFLGSWNVVEDCSSSPAAAYDITSSPGSTIIDVNITNFWGLFVAQVKATVDGDVITIDRQEPDGDGFFVEGTGTIDVSGAKPVITATYTVTDETDPANILSDICTGSVWTKN